MPSISNEILQAKRDVETEILKRPGVTGIDVGLKLVGGERTDTVAIRVHVRHKRDVPEAQRIPVQIQGFPTDVIEAEYFAAGMCTDKNKDKDPYVMLWGGISGGPADLINGLYYAGTLGLPMKDAGGKYYLLTNAHVLNPSNGPQQNYLVIQPAVPDGGEPHFNSAGHVAKVILGGTPTVDAGIVLLPGNRTQPLIVDIGAVTGQAVAQLNQTVRKRGRTTRLTSGVVDGLDASITVDYGNNYSVSFTGQISIVPVAAGECFATKGDSGSAVVNSSNQVLGLYFAEVPTTGRGVANPISDVLTALNSAGFSVSIYVSTP